MTETSITAPSQFSTWKTIRLGTGLKTADSFRAALKNSGYSISYFANEILNKPAFTVAGRETEIKLIVVSAAELGFKHGTAYKDICTRARELNLDLCPAEVGPQLRLQYPNQPYTEWLRIGMEAITDTGGNQRIFAVDRGANVCWLDAVPSGPDHFWAADYRFAFVDPR